MLGKRRSDGESGTVRWRDRAYNWAWGKAGRANAFKDVTKQAVQSKLKGIKERRGRVRDGYRDWRDRSRSRSMDRNDSNRRDEGRTAGEEREVFPVNENRSTTGNKKGWREKHGANKNRVDERGRLVDWEGEARREAEEGDVLEEMSVLSGKTDGSNSRAESRMRRWKEWRGKWRRDRSGESRTSEGTAATAAPGDREVTVTAAPGDGNKGDLARRMGESGRIRAKIREMRERWKKKD